MWTPCDDPIDEYNEKTGKIIGTLALQNNLVGKNNTQHTFPHFTLITMIMMRSSNL